MRIYKYHAVSSTQDLAKHYLEKNNKNAAFVADSQTAGYGKRGRSFYSPAQTGVYLSVAFPHFKLDRKHAGLLTLAVGVKTIQILQKFSPFVNLQLKWVNDIYLGHKKIAGILTEMTKFGLVIGIGVNIATISFPAEISDHVGSLKLKDFDMIQISKELTRAIIQATKIYVNPTFLDEYRSLSYLNNKIVTLKIGRKYIKGKVSTIDNSGKIVIKTKNSMHAYSSGEVTKVELNL